MQTRMFYGEKSDDTEWSSNIGVVRQWAIENGFVRAAYLYAGVKGRTERDYYRELPGGAQEHRPFASSFSLRANAQSAHRRAKPA